MDERLRRTAQDILDSEHPSQQESHVYLVAVVEEAIQRKIKKNTLGVSRDEFPLLLSDKEKEELLRMLAVGKPVPQPQESTEPEPFTATARKTTEPPASHYPVRNIWVLGTFFLLLFIVILGSLAITANTLASYLIIPVIIISVILVVIISTVILVAAGILDQSIYQIILDKLSEWLHLAQTKKS